MHILEICTCLTALTMLPIAAEGVVEYGMKIVYYINCILVLLNCSNTRVDIAFYISEYTYHSNNYCAGEGNGYRSLESAKSACANSLECQCIFQNECRGGTWYTRTGSNFSSPSGSCAWVKRKLTIPYHAQKLIIFFFSIAYIFIQICYMLFQ